LRSAGQRIVHHRPLMAGSLPPEWGEAARGLAKLEVQGELLGRHGGYSAVTPGRADVSCSRRIRCGRHCEDGNGFNASEGGVSGRASSGEDIGAGGYARESIKPPPVGWSGDTVRGT